jgi:hypothetical protein
LERKKQEEEERKELEAAVEYSKVLTKQQRIEALQRSLPQEPTDTKGVADIAIRMPDGAR